MSTELVKNGQLDPAMLERVLLTGDLSGLRPQDRLSYYKAVCESLGLNPLTKPFDYLELDGKTVLYTKKDCTDQLRNIHGVSVKIVSREVVEGVYVVTSQATKPDGRTDESIGAVPLLKEKGEWKNAQSGKRYFQGTGEYMALSPDAKANAIMKAETKSKRRVTLSICGLGLMDESELDTVQGGRPMDFDPAVYEQTRSQKIAEAEEYNRKIDQSRKPVEEAVRTGEAYHAKPVATLDEVPPPVAKLWADMGTKIASVCVVFNALKSQLSSLSGNEEEYYMILNKHGFEHGNDVKKLGIAKARQCVRELWEAAEQWRKANEPEAVPALFDMPDAETVYGD
jgi:hypothetical protein